MKSFKSFVFFLLFLFVQVPASQSRDINLEQLVSKADAIFSGRCISAKEETIKSDQFPSGIVTTRYFFQVEKSIKGAAVAGKEFSFAVTGGSKPKEGQPAVMGMPRFSEGKDYLLFLTSESKLGVRAPIGLWHGKFDVVEEGGKMVVKNRYDNKNLFMGVPTSKMTKGVSSSSSGPIPLDDFVKIIEEMKK